MHTLKPIGNYIYQLLLTLHNSAFVYPVCLSVCICYTHSKQRLFRYTISTYQCFERPPNMFSVPYLLNLYLYCT